jgi:hypothetical protein
LTRAFHTIFSQIVTELGKECFSKQCPNITAGKDLVFECMNHGNLDLKCCAIDYYLHTLDRNMVLLTNPAYFSDRDNIRDYSAQVFPKMMRYLYRMLAHICYHHKKLFGLLQHRYRIAERLTLYCQKIKAIDNPKE